MGPKRFSISDCGQPRGLSILSKAGRYIKNLETDSQREACLLMEQA
jgi:hypothetical protein